MKKILAILFLLINCMIMDAQNAVEWANLTKYKDSNEQIAKRPDVLFLGNSITEGWVNAMPDFFTENNFVGRGISGQVSSQLLLRFRQDVIDLKPKILIINIGTNDVAENAGPYNEQFTIGNIESMIQLAKANKIKVILASVIPATKFYWRDSVTNAAEKIISLNKCLLALSKKHKISYLDYHSKLKNSENGLSSDMAEDGVHPTLKCFEIMAKMVLKSLGK